MLCFWFYILIRLYLCRSLDDDASDLVGRGAKRGLIFYLPPEGTLVLNNIHEAPPGVIPLLQREVATATMAASMDDEDDDADEGAAGTPIRRPRCIFPRIIMVTEINVPALEQYATVIRVPPLRVRPQDIGDLANFFLRSLARRRRLGALYITPEAIKRLEAWQYPNNVRELQGMVERAVAQAMKSGDTTSTSGVIGEDVFWFASPERDLLRANLLKTIPVLRTFFRSDTWPKEINFKFTVYAFAAIVAILFLGPQDREHNFALNAFWCYWWPLSFIVYPFLGRVWCAVCPFMIYGELVQQWRLATGGVLRKWPREFMDKWGAWFLFGMFAAILIWEEVWDLPHTAALSSWLLLLITAGAMICSALFERRLWCRFLCPIGGMNGLFAKLSVTELRARQGVCAAECSTYTCYKGGPAVPPEGIESPGCPVYSHPAQLTDNRNCVLCMECLKACPHRSIEFRLRVPAADLWGGLHVPIPAESALMYMLLGAVYLHSLPTLLNEAGIDPGAAMGITPIHLAVSAGVLATPGAIAWGVDAGWRLVAQALIKRSAQAGTSLSFSSTGATGVAHAVSVLESAAVSYAGQAAKAPIVAPAKSFLELSYGYLPFVWSSTLAYYLPYFLTEGGNIIPVTASTFGLDPPPEWLPTLQAAPDVVTFLQGATVIGGTVLSLGMMRRIAGQPWRIVIHHCGLIVCFAAELWHILIQ